VSFAKQPDDLAASEPRLLDAAHTVIDADENGLPLTKLHHAAFDAKFIDIDPDSDDTRLWMVGISRCRLRSLSQIC
jgi:hypothetical protein